MKRRRSALERIKRTSMASFVVEELAYAAPAPVRIAAPVPVVWASHQLLEGRSFYASDGAHRANYRSDRSTYAGGGEHRARLAVSVVPESAVCAAPTPVAKSFRCVCRVRGAGIRSVCGARTSGRVFSAFSVSIEAPEPAVCAALAPVAEYIREAWRQLQAAETLRRHYCILEDS